MIAYSLPSGGGTVDLTPEVLAHVHANRQKRVWSKEAGGLLFGRFDGDSTIVHLATGPRRLDKRSRFLYEPNFAAEQREILEQHALGLHYVGAWHTHPERFPAASRLDTSSMRECVSTATHDLSGFLLLVVGIDNPPRGLHLSFVGRETTWTLLPARQADAPRQERMGQGWPLRSGSSTY